MPFSKPHELKLLISFNVDYVKYKLLRQPAEIGPRMTIVQSTLILYSFLAYNHIEFHVQVGQVSLQHGTLQFHSKFETSCTVNNYSGRQ